jgi:stress response protein YsnF
MKTVIGAFCDRASALEALNYIRTHGATGAELIEHRQGDLLANLQGFNIPDNRAQLYAETLRRGGAVVAAHTDDNAANQIATDLDRFGSLDLEAAESRWRAAGWDGYDMNAAPYAADLCADEQAALRRESGLETATGTPGAQGQAIDVIEEEVQIGKREVSRGGVRVRSFILERPVREQVELREERVEVTREPANEPVAAPAADSTFTEEEFEVTARGEEAVVGKEARVVERVHVGKTAETRTETIEETERRRDVEVSPIDEDPHARRR